MLEENYKNGISEVLEILKYSEKEYTDKLPKKLISFFKENASKTYKPQIDVNKKIEDMDLLPETKGLLSLLYMDYWSTPEEKEEFKKVLKNNQEKIEQELREKYNPDKIFDRPEEKVEESQKLETDEPEINQGVSENEALTEYHESFMKNLINKIKEFIKNLFNKN